MKKILLYSLAFICLAATNAIANTTEKYPDGELRKTINKEFPINGDGLLKISNKYGNMELMPGDAGKVKFDIEVIVDSPKDEMAQKKLDAITVEFTDSGSTVTAETKIEHQDNKDWWGSWKNKSGKSVKYKIHYKVYIPSDINVNLYQKYGDINMTDIDGNAEIEIKYGNLGTGDVRGKMTLQLGYGKAKVQEIGNLDLDMKYSAFGAESVKNIQVTSKYSKFNIPKAQNISSTSKYDDYKLGTINDFDNTGKYDDISIESVDNINVGTKYTGLVVDNVNGEAELKFSYGKIKLKGAGSGFGGADITGKYTAIYVDIAQDYRIETHTQYEKTKLSEAFTVVNRDSGKKEETLKAYKGNRSAPLIRVSAKYGSVRFK